MFLLVSFQYILDSILMNFADVCLEDQELLALFSVQVSAGDTKQEGRAAMQRHLERGQISTVWTIVDIHRSNGLHILAQLIIKEAHHMALQSHSSVKGEMNWSEQKLKELQAQNSEKSSLF